MKFLALGSALCLFKDIDQALSLGEYDGVVAANEAGVAWSGELTSWVSLHPLEMPGRVARRAARGHPPALEIVSHPVDQKPDVVTTCVPYKLPGQKTSGSSGLFAVKRALDLGATKVVCCGIPIDADLGRIDGKEVWTSARLFRQGWEQSTPVLRGRVKSMSGWTRQLLGEPTPEWFSTSVGSGGGKPPRVESP